MANCCYDKRKKNLWKVVTDLISENQIPDLTNKISFSDEKLEEIIKSYEHNSIILDVVDGKSFEEQVKNLKSEKITNEIIEIYGINPYHKHAENLLFRTLIGGENGFGVSLLYLIFCKRR